MQPRTRTTPLRRESSYDNNSRMGHTPPHPEELSPYHKSHSSSPSIRQPQPFTLLSHYNGDFNLDNNTNEQLITAIPRNLFPTNDLNKTQVDRLRTLRNEALSFNLHGLSSFIGEKLIFIANDEKITDVYQVSLSYYQQQQYERALMILNRNTVINESVKCRYLAALCSVSVKFVYM
jgi:hypothetical protein